MRVAVIVTWGALAFVACASFESSPEDGSGDAGGDAAVGPDGGPGDAQGIDVVEVNDGGCSPDGILTTTQNTPSRVGTDGTYVYWLEAQARIMRASPVTCATSEIAAGSIDVLAVDKSYVVWGVPEYRGLATASIGESPHEALPTPGPSTVLNQYAFWLDPSRVIGCASPCNSTFIAVLVGAPTHLVAGGSRIFFFGTHPDGGTDVNLWWRAAVGAVNEPQGPLATQTQPTHAAASSNRVYWVESDGRLQSVDHGGGSVDTLATVLGVSALTADNAGIYVADALSIRRFNPSGVAQAGLVVATLAASMPVSSMVVVGDRLAWAVPSEKVIRHAAK